jgi:hypothetical protein
VGTLGKALKRLGIALLTLLKWSLIGFALLTAGGFFGRGLSALWQDQQVIVDKPFLWTLFVFAAGGGVALAVLIVAWRVSTADYPGKVAALILLLIVAGGVVIWPTPYKYHRTKELDVVVRINRITGDICYQVKPGSEVNSSSASSTEPRC